MDIKLAHKAVKAARLAADEAARQDHDEAAYSQGRIAGELASKAGMTTDELAKHVPQLMAAAAYPAWNGIVDGWYEAQPKDVTVEEVTDLLYGLDRTGTQEQRDLVARMWSELQRRRGL